MSKRLLANGRGRWLALAMSLVVSAGMLYAQVHEPGTRGERERSAGNPAASPSVPAPPPGEFAQIPIPTEAELLAASAPVGDAQTFQLALPRGVAPEGGLQVRTIWVARAISVLFPEITTIGGYRQDPLKWHPNGLAIDVMIPNYHSAEGIELGNQIAGMALANARRWGFST